MKIVHIIFSFNIGGSETMLVDIVNEQVKGHKVFLFVINSTYNIELLSQIDKNVKVILLDRKPSSLNYIPFLKLNYKLLKINPDVIHCHHHTIVNALFPLWKNKCLTLHCMGLPTQNLKKYDKVFAISDSVKIEIQERTDVSIDVVSNGIKISDIARRELKHYKNDFKIVQVARLDSDIKGQDIIIKAISLLKNKGIINNAVVFIGEGKSENKLKVLARELGVENQVVFKGACSRNIIYKNLKNYDLMCHPARQEGFGLVVVEGISALLPVLVPNQGGAFEVINQGKYGTVFEDQDPESCANKILEIMNTYDVKLQQVIKAFDHINKHYSINIMVQKYLESYKNDKR